MFENLGWWEIGALLLLALFIFGPDRLPKFIADTASLLRKVRGMATSATADLRDQLGPDVDIADLHPKRFVQRHLLSDEDGKELMRPFNEVLAELNDTERSVRSSLAGKAKPVPELPPTVAGAPAALPKFDPDAT